MIPIDFRTEEEARAFARSQPPGVIGVVPSTVTEPGDKRWNDRAARLAQARDARRLVRRERARQVLRFLAVVWMLVCVTATVWFVHSLWTTMQPARALTGYHALPVVGVPISVPGPGCTTAEVGP